ncbi:MAG: hypothetical protein P9L96_05980 [Candidatus Gygaella obscura]|nr:hypothetical protein [Candidatus Gygaella obscura]
MRSDLESVFESVLTEYLNQSGLVLVDTHINKTRQSFNIRVLLDKPDGGITLGECSQANKEIRKSLEEKDFLASNFLLEVCSPGIGRLLLKESDFRRVKGKNLKVILKDEFDKVKELEANLLDVFDGSLILKQDNGEINIKLESIIKAKQVIK